MIRKILLFFAGLILVLLMCGMLYMSGAIYDTATKTSVVPYFFETNLHYPERLGTPDTPDELASDAAIEESEMFKRLVERSIIEMFYVTPDATELKSRLEGQTALGKMLYRSAFVKWQELIAPEIEKLTTERKLRLVKLVNIIPEEQYFNVVYELKTWNQSNNLEISPEISYDAIYLNIRYEPGMRTSIGKKSVEQWLEQGKDPATAFRFMVMDIAIPQEE